MSLPQHARANPTGAEPDWALGRGNQPLAAAELFNRSQWDRWGKVANRDSNTTDFCCSYQHQLDFLKWNISYLLYALKRISKEFKQLKNNYIHRLNCCAQERTHWTSYPPGVHLLKFIVRLYYDTWTVQCSSVAQLCLTLCDPMDCSAPGLPVHHQLLEFTQTHVHWVSDAIQPSHPLLSPYPPAFNLSQHQGVFRWVSSLHQAAKVLEFQLQHQSFQWTFRTDFL